MVSICSYCLAVFGLKENDRRVLARNLTVGTNTGASCPNTLPSLSTRSVEEADHSRDVELEENQPGDQPVVKKARLSPTHSQAPAPSSQCSLCLGLNSESYIELLVETILEKLATENYQGISSFVLAVHAPLSLKVRRMGMEYFLMSIQLGTSDSLGKDTDGIMLESQSNSQPGPTQAPDSQVKFISDEYYVKTNVRLRTKYMIEKKRPHLMYNVDSPFLVTVKLNHVTSNQDCMPVVTLASDSVPKVKGSRHRSRHKPSIITTNIVNDSIDALTPKDYTDNGFFLTPVLEPCTYVIEFTHKPVFVGGRYNKYSRTLPQTPWIVDGERKADSSVEELICDKLTSLLRADGHNFSSSGREDVDVRMLGNGRPFLVEFLNPRNHTLTSEDLESVQRDINSSTTRIQVQRLTIVSKESTNILKKGEEEKVKCYSSVIWSPEEVSPESIRFLDEISNLELDQRTPIRVLHRRTLATRKRTVYDLKAQYIDSHHFTLLLSTQAGTYVKEFVHGDFGRTQPNLRVLMRQDVDILSLDVLEVKLDWPV